MTQPLPIALKLAAGIFSAITVGMALPSVPARAANPVPPLQECWSTEDNTLDAGQLQRAIAACSLLLKDTNMPAEARAGAYLHRGLARRRSGELADALGDLLAAKQYAPGDAGIARMLAWIYRELERPQDAEAEYDRALDIDPHWQGYLSRCVVRVDRKDYARALEDCRTAAKSTENEDITYFTALALARLAKFPDAIAVLTPAANGPQASVRIFELLASIHETEGRRADATRVLGQGRAKFPSATELTAPTKLQ
jgi:tetratricopeptide (TPR) repeat protein